MKLAAMVLSTLLFASTVAAQDHMVTPRDQKKMHPNLPLEEVIKDTTEDAALMGKPVRAQYSGYEVFARPMRKVDNNCWIVHQTVFKATQKISENDVKFCHQ